MAFYLGELVQQDAGGAFRIVSKDGGFDPLIAHLQADGIDVERLESLRESDGITKADSGEPLAAEDRPPD